MAWLPQDIMQALNGNNFFGGAAPQVAQQPYMPETTMPLALQAGPPAQNSLAALLGGAGAGLAGGGQEQNPLMAMAMQLLPQLLQEQRQLQPQQVNRGDLQRYLMMQAMQQSPFYQGQQVQGAGGQIMGALMPFLMARAQAPLMEQMYNAQLQKSQGSGVKTLMDALTAMMGLQTAQAESKRATAEAGKAEAEAKNVPIKEAREAAKDAADQAFNKENARITKEFNNKKLTLEEAKNEKIAAHYQWLRKRAEAEGDGNYELKMLEGGEYVGIDPATGKHVKTNLKGYIPLTDWEAMEQAAERMKAKKAGQQTMPGQSSGSVGGNMSYDPQTKIWSKVP